jgi:hypothetical protein
MDSGFSVFAAEKRTESVDSVHSAGIHRRLKHANWNSRIVNAMDCQDLLQYPDFRQRVRR